MNKQEIFNIIYRALLKQNAKSLIYTYGDSRCAYRGLEGLKCAAGHLIQDDEMQPWMENLRFIDVLSDERCPLSLKERLGEHRYFIESLQQTHDSYNPDEWKCQLEREAELENLTIPEL